MRQKKEKRKFHYGFLIVVCCCVFSFTSVALCFGCAGIFYTPVSEALGVSRGTFALSTTMMSLASGLSVSIVSRLIEKYTLKRLLIIDLLLQIVCFALQSRFTKVYLFYITGIGMGFVQAFMTSMLMTVVLNRWFKTKVGFFIGLSSSMTGVSGIIINPLAGKFMVNFGWQMTYLLYAAIIAVIALPFAIFVFKDDPRDIGIEPYGMEEAEKYRKEHEGEVHEATGVPYHAAVNSKAFIYAVIAITSIGATSNFIQYIPSYASSLGMSLTFAAALAGISQVGTLIGKNTLGAISDKNTAAAFTTGALTSFLGLFVMFFFGTASTLAMQSGAAIFGMIYASTTVMNPLLIIAVFGMKDYTKIYGRTSVFSAISGAVSASLWGFLADLCGGSFTAPMSICIVLCLLGCFAGNAALREGKKLKRV